jgi:hypothetical protein
MRTIAYITSAGGAIHARTVRSDGSGVGESEVLLQRERPVFEVLHTTNEEGLIFREGNAEAGEADLGYLDLRTGEVNEQLLASTYNERAVALSPDGHWLAYVSDHTGDDQVFVRPFPAVSSRLTPISTAGGTEPVWAHNGRELFFRDVEGWMNVVTFEADSLFTVVNRERLFDANRFLALPQWHAYDVDLDDERFLMIGIASLETQVEGPETILVQILNWFTELDEQLGGGGS